MEALTDDQRTRTLARFEELRQSWARNWALRTLYADLYRRVTHHLPAADLGPFIEIGSGPGFARSFIPTLQLSDIVRASWHDHEIRAEVLPFGDASVGALVLFDVLHHMEAPARFFDEAARALKPGGRVVLCEPYISPISSLVYRLFHEEPVMMGADPLADWKHNPKLPPTSGDGEPTRDRKKDPFDSNQGIPTLLFARGAGRREFARRVPGLRLVQLERLAGFAYPASGGFARPPFLPNGLWRLLFRLEQMLPAWLFRLIGFRMIVVLEKTAPSARCDEFRALGRRLLQILRATGDRGFRPKRRPSPTPARCAAGGCTWPRARNARANRS